MTGRARSLGLWVFAVALLAAPARAGEAPPGPERTVRVSVVAQKWCDEDRTLEAVLRYVEAAAAQGADIVALPQECVKTDGEPIPGPIADALAREAAKRHVWLIGNLREKDAAGTFVTSFLCDRQGKIVGKYRKSHRMPDEDVDLGDDLPVFATEFGPVAMRVGTDRFFADIDHVYTAKGARIVFWAQMPEPVEDEYSQDFPSAGRAADYRVVIACSRYASGRPGYITNFYPPYCGRPIGRAYVVNREGQRVACTAREAGGVATATIPLAQLEPGRGADRRPGFAALTAPVALPPTKEWAKRKVRLTVVEAEPSIDSLLQKLDVAGHLGSDCVCCYEYVWITGPDDSQVRQAKANLERVALKAKEHRMYVLIAGVIDRLERNEAILFDRDGKEAGRFFKIAKTHDQQIVGEDTPVFETDFGRVACRICADEWMVEMDRCYAIKGADILFTPTQSWGPDALFRDLRDLSRAMDTGLFLVECTHPSTEVRHRSLIVEPTGVVVARSEYREASVFSAVVDLDHDRPLRYVRQYKPHTPAGYLPEYQPDRMPEAVNDLRDVILMQRRPELYGVLAPQAK